MRIGLFTATALAFVLAAADPSTPASAATAPKTQALATSAAPLSVKLAVSTRDAIQFHGVLLDAQASEGDIVSYVFAYGDGIVESSYQPFALHGYRKPGTYNARVAAIDASGQGAVSTAVTIHVSDGLPPVVRIDQPRPGQRLRLGAAGIRFTGSARDSDGVTKVELAIQLVSSAQHFKTGGGCIWYDGHTSLVLANCSNPQFFNVSSAHGRWSFRMGPNVRIPAGRYVVRVRAIDRAGNISHYYALPLHTILPFELVR